MNRDAMLARARRPGESEPWDLVVVGGGATGVGIALDAASRGYRTLLLERGDFGKGTSSRSTKLVHGGLRYLERGDIGLVIAALRERGILRRNAPHLVGDLAFVVPSYDWWEAPFYGIGLKVYDWLAGKYGFGRSEILSREQTLERLPTIETRGLRGGVVYYDGQFDDARLLIQLAETAAEQGAVLLNYAEAVGVTRGSGGAVDGVIARDAESAEEWRVRARLVVNAAGPFVDAVRRLAEPEATPILAPSQGIHLVFDETFLPGDHAILVPHTSDGRVMFAIPWHGHTLVGTTDTPIETAAEEPRPLPEEIDFLLATAGRYLRRAPSRADVRSVFVGIRPLVRSGDPRSTATLSRDHVVRAEASGLLTVAGGKWTIYRQMAEDAVDRAAELAGLPKKECATRTLHVHGYDPEPDRFGELRVYGSDALAIRDLIREEPALGARLHPALPYVGAEVVWAVRSEMARTVEDVLARRLRALFLDARAAGEMAPAVARLAARELGWDAARELHEVDAFRELARGYRLE
ncbi:MAG TPA: glycerol-3-phosphate dehydrogenase/oxidase [Thermoanaerobaculia bacterium]|jgi:glycerol-3-phosphate dehydrogenase